MKYTKKQNLYCDLVETTTLIFSFALAVFLGIFLVIINPNCKASFAETMAEDKIYCTYTLDDNFNDSCVMVVIDIYTSDINKNQDDLFLQLFSDNIIASIEDLSYIDCESTTKKYINNGDFRQILKLNLVERSKQNVLEVIEIVTEIDGVLWAGVDMVIEFDSLPHSADGSKYFYQWPLHWDYGVDIEPAWECTAGDSDIKVGIIDSGIEIHDDLSGNVADGWDFYNDNGVTTDDLTGHGTHIAGIIGATGNNLEGLVGVCQNIKLVPLQVTDDMGKPSSSVIVKAIQWAENNDLDILNYSLGSYEPIVDIATAINNFNGLIVCSAGNDTADNDQIPTYPAVYTMGQTFSGKVISVGASDIGGAMASFSNYGETTVDIFAPGDGIYSTYLNNSYKASAGTSYSTPFVTGVAALLMSYNSSLKPEDVKSIIINTAVYDARLDGLCVSDGRLSASNALNSVNPAFIAINDYGFNGSNYSWKGELHLEYDPSATTDYEHYSTVYQSSAFTLHLQTTKSSNNSGGDISDSILIELCPNGTSTVIQSFTTDVNISSSNKVTFESDSFNLWTTSLENDTYTLNMWYVHYDGTSYTYKDLGNYMFFVRQPVEAMSGFGHNDSWYRWNGSVDISSESYLLTSSSVQDLTMSTVREFTFTIGSNFAYNAWHNINGNISIVMTNSSGEVVPIEGKNAHTTSLRVGIVSNASFSDRDFIINSGDLPNDTYTLSLTCTTNRDGEVCNTSGSYSFVVDIEDSCVAQGTMVTLADGTQVAVEDLTGSEELLVWNMMTGQFDSAPILFIDSDAIASYEVVELTFADGTTVKVIDEHGFWNATLNEYVFLDSNADTYIGDYFNKQTYDSNGNMVYTTVQLVSVDSYAETTSAWSPVTYSYLCYYVNGMLSMPGGTASLINIFDVDAETMTIDMDSYNADIAEYGLFTYEEFAEIMPVSEEVFNAFNAQYFKVAMGKGILTWESLATLFDTYQDFLI